MGTQRVKSFIRSIKTPKFLLVLLLGIFLLFKPPIDPDFGWHFKSGEYMIQNRQFLRENIFSYTMPDYKWANSYWIPQIVMYSLYSLSQTIGITGDIGMGLILSTLASLAILAILKKAPLKKWQIATGALFIFFYTSHFTIAVRPLLFSTVFMLFLLHTILHKPQNIKFLPILFLIWANSHADFTLGLFILGLFNIQKLLFEGIKKENLVTLVSSLACVAITLVTPYGTFLWETLLKETHPLQFSHIMEWVPLENKSYLPVYYIASGLILASVIEMKEKKKNLWLIISTCFFFIASVRMAYFGRVFVLLGVFPLLNFLNQLSGDFAGFKKFLGDTNWKKVLLTNKVIAGLVVAVSIGHFGENLYNASLEERWAKKAGHPYEAVQKIKQEGLKGNMFNEYSWGGYLIWKLPEHKVFIDGRMPSWRDETGYSIFEEYLEMKKRTASSDEWDKYNIKWEITESGWEVR